MIEKTGTFLASIATSGAQISSSNRLVISSGSAFSFSPSDDITIEISGLKIIFEFFDTEDGKQNLERDIVSNTALKLKLYNFNNMFGSGLTNPIEIGTLNHKKLYLMFVVSALNKSTPKNLHYTFFQE